MFTASRQPSSDLGWVARWLALGIVCTGVVAFAISCQQGGSESHGSSAGAAASANGEMASTMPAGEGAAASSTLPDAKALGFSYPSAPANARPAEEVASQNKSCVACHVESDTHTMHATDIGVSCVDCHGGKWDVEIPANFTDDFAEYTRFKRATHVLPKKPEIWQTANGLDTAANPQVTGATTAEEHQDFIRFINPGDLRAAEVACGACHNTEADGYIVNRIRKSMMTHGGMLWGAAMYNNGTYYSKDPIFGEFYTEDGEPARVVANPRVTVGQMRDQGRLPQMLPLQRWEISQPGNILRVFERGGKSRPQIGIPNPNPPQGGQAGIEDPGKPEVKLSIRGFGTDLRTDPVTIGLQKTRLLDPTLNFMGTNDHAGDYRGSGCSACHVVYANDRSPVHSGKWAMYGNRGESFSKDPTVNPPVNGKSQTEPYADAWKAPEKSRERGHPIQHAFVKNAPNANCMTCHMHPGTLVLNSYLGLMWWDNESDGAFMYPKKQKYPTADDFYEAHKHNPEGSVARGLWSNMYPNDTDHMGNVAGENFLDKVGTPDFNAKLKNNHFADFHGHGWIFRAVFKQDRKGHLLDINGNKVEKTPDNMAAAVNFQSNDTNVNPPAGNPVHLKDVHLERGMHCVDCHFDLDSHGDGNLYGETRNATSINCEDCHGTMERPAKMVQYFMLSSGDQRGKKGDDLLAEMFSGNSFKNKDRKQTIARSKKLLRKFQWNAGTKTLRQKSQLEDGKGWTVDQTSDTTLGVWQADKPGSAGKRASAPPKQANLETKDPDERRAILARFAHTIRRDGKTWGGDPDANEKNPAMQLAHGSDTMSCYACHTSWNTSCFGCHLPQRANQRRDMLHNEAQKTRNYTNYNFQTLRDDVFMLGIDSTVKGHKVVPIRSACAVMVSSQDALRQWIYPQQQTVSAEGFAGTAFSPYFPHTVRSVETKQCTDCHISSKGDNNAIMAQVLLQGTNSVNFIGRFAWVGLGEGGMEAVAVTERDEPQAVIGSKLHSLAYPDFYAEHERNHHALKTAHEHHGKVLDLVQRGEYVYTACGEGGFRAYDIANLDNKGFSERIVTAPVSPLGQRFDVPTKYATSVTTPSTLAIDPTRPKFLENQEQNIHLMYAFLYVTDREEGIVVIGNPINDTKNKAGVATLLDGDPDNNFLKRAYAFNPGNVMKGARQLVFHGTLAYVVCDTGIVVVDFDNPLDPQVVKVMSEFNGARKLQFQFRYGFVLDNEGMKVLDVTDPRDPKLVPGANVPFGDARDLYVARTYAYVAAGNQGLAIVDLTTPTKPVLDQVFDAEGHMNDATAVKTGMTNSSLFAYVADGKNGLKVIQLWDEDTPGYMGFSPRPTPRLIAERHTHEPAIAIGEGLDRDRAVDESGHQLSVFGRRGARPFNAEEQKRLYLMPDANGARTKLYTVGDFPTNQPVAPKAAPAGTGGTEERPAGPRRPGRRGGAATPAPAAEPAAPPPAPEAAPPAPEAPPAPAVPEAAPAAPEAPPAPAVPDAAPAAPEAPPAPAVPEAAPAAPEAPPAPAVPEAAPAAPEAPPAPAVPEAAPAAPEPPPAPAVPDAAPAAPEPPPAPVVPDAAPAAPEPPPAPAVPDAAPAAPEPPPAPAVPNAAPAAPEPPAVPPDSVPTPPEPPPAPPLPEEPNK